MNCAPCSVSARPSTAQPNPNTNRAHPLGARSGRETASQTPANAPTTIRNVVTKWSGAAKELMASAYDALRRRPQQSSLLAHFVPLESIRRLEGRLGQSIRRLEGRLGESIRRL